MGLNLPSSHAKANDIASKSPTHPAYSSTPGSQAIDAKIFYQHKNSILKNNQTIKANPIDTIFKVIPLERNTYGIIIKDNALRMKYILFFCFLIVYQKGFTQPRIVDTTYATINRETTFIDKRGNFSIHVEMTLCDSFCAYVTIKNSGKNILGFITNGSYEEPNADGVDIYRGFILSANVLADIQQESLAIRSIYPKSKYSMNINLRKAKTQNFHLVVYWSVIDMKKQLEKNKIKYILKNLYVILNDIPENFEFNQGYSVISFYDVRNVTRKDNVMKIISIDKLFK